MNRQEQKSFNNPPRSYWMDTMSSRKYPTLDKDIKADVAIIGGGMVGILTGYLLSKQGIKVAILEGSEILKGTTGHTTAKITSQHGLIYNKIKSQMGEELARQYADANENAINDIKAIMTENQIECDYIQQSAYIYTLQDHYVTQIDEEVKAAAALGIKATYLDQISLNFPIKAAVRFDNQAQFHPLKFLAPLAEKIVNSGGQIFEHSRVIKVENDDGYTLVTRQGKKVMAKKVIIASHYPCVNKPDFYFARIYPKRSYVVAIKAKENYPGGMYINAEEPTRSLRSQVFNGGELILVGGENHKTGQGEDTTLHYETLIDYANEIYTVEDIPYRWSTQDCMTLDDIPYVGQFTPKTPNMYVATGFGKWGMTNSMASSRLLTELITKGSSPWQEVYNPSRETLMASSKNFVTQNANVGAELVKGKLAPVIKELDIHPGEGKIIEANGQKAGAYRDEEGKLHVVDTTCTHMGCELKWNSAEKSWDCPCHGSRFNCQGDVIEGPAVSHVSFEKDTNTIKKLITEDF